MANFVQHFRSTDVGAPVITGQVGTGVAAFLTMLVNGYATLSVTGLVEVGTTVTATLAASNATLRTNDYVKIAGASPAGANGTFLITVVDNTHFTYQAAAALGSITGTVVYNKASLGWTQPFTSTNSAQFKMGNSAGYLGGALHVIEVLDNGAFAGGAKEMGVRPAISTTGMGAWTGEYPTAAQQTNGMCWTKSTTADGTARAWTLIGHDAGFSFIINAGGTTTTICGGDFGWFPTYVAGDAYNSLISGSPTFNSAIGVNGIAHCQTANSLTSAVNGIYCARASSQTGGSISCNLYTGGGNGSAYAAGGAAMPFTYPNGPDGALAVAVPLVTDGLAFGYRGRMAGKLVPMHNQPLGIYDPATNIAGLAGVTGIAIPVSSGNLAGQLIFDALGPW